MSGEKVKLTAFLVQGAASVSIAYLVSLTGFVYAWPSYTVAMFMSNETTLSAPMSSLEISLLGSLTNVGALVATPLCGYALNICGRKYSAMLFGLPFVLAWSIIALTTSVPLVIFALTLAGIGAAGQAVSSVYIAEISQDSIRGGLTSATVFEFFLGLLMSYALGGYLSYHQVVYTHLILSILYVILISFLKDSPVYLLQIGKEEEAAKSIAFYRRVDVKSKEVEVEIQKIKLQLDPSIEKKLQDENDDVANNLLDNNPSEVVQQESEWKFLMKSKSSQRALISALLLMAITIFMGNVVLQVYAEPLFKEAVPSMPSNLCSIFLAIDYTLASLLGSFVIDKFGRKFLLIVSSIASGVSSCLLGSQIHLHWASHWVTAVFIYGFCFVYNLGVAVVPFVYTAEVFLPEVRGLGNSMVMASMWICNFLTLMVFNPLVEYFGLGQLFYGFSGVCFLAAVFGHFCIPETKGLSADAIQLLFLKKKKKPEKV